MSKGQQQHRDVDRAIERSAQAVAAFQAAESGRAQSPLARENLAPLAHVSAHGMLGDGNTERGDNPAHRLWLGRCYGIPGVWIDFKDQPNAFIPLSNVGQWTLKDNPLSPSDLEAKAKADEAAAETAKLEVERAKQAAEEAAAAALAAAEHAKELEAR